MKALSKILLVLLIAFGLGSCSAGQPAATANSGQMNDGKPAPSFEVIDLQGNTHQLSDYAGQKVYVKFWASWCSICLAGMEELNTLAGEETEFAVLSIVSPSSNAEKDSESFAKWFKGVENTSNIQVLLDEGGPVFEQYGIIGYPTSVYIGSDGVLAKRQQGHVSNEQIKATFESIQ
ncbi:TlpA disulfide reductase family protein [Planomicrobium sp. CPCC 101079]|uniref:TlpA family protein disulfide reductase n=1 Tax=Planomicrobium sp. CPCC 101079 TaxID=2599618 RepID=UPI0011B5FAD8|nr:TlpA disulfide reductase family protein [Planomicrobium sp. CPCC 101079]TWT01464.1 TlpA family protein disulfide reductase [Planomicrobium sp. CPCC 101079]